MPRKYDDPEEQQVSAPAAELLTVADLAEKHGHAYTPVVEGDTRFSRSHLGADAAHGWTRHKAFKSEDVKLSAADYLAAIAAFDKGEVHAPANKRGETTFTQEQAESKLASDSKLGAAQRKAKQANSAQRVQPNHAHNLAMKKAKTLAESSGTKMRGR
jgi:hypothetical protein